MQPIFPDLVSQGPDGYLAVNYAGLAPYLVKAIQQLFQKLQELAATVANFAESFTTKELIATNVTFHSLTTEQLCALKSDGTSVCVTGDELSALLSHAANDNTPTSVTSSPSNPRDPDATSTPDDLTNIVNPDNAISTSASGANDDSASSTLPAANDNRDATATDRVDRSSI